MQASPRWTGRIGQTVALLLAAAGLAACLPAGGPSSAGAGAMAETDAARTETVLAGALAECTTDTGYDPQSPESLALGPFELGEGELAWRDCAYASAERIVGTQLALPANLDRVLAADRQLTAAITAGAATREDRQRTIDAMVAEVRQNEMAIRQAAAPGTDAAAGLSQDPALEALRRELEILNRLVQSVPVPG